MDGQTAVSPGVYGLRVEGLGTSGSLLRSAPPEWPKLQVDRTVDTTVGTAIEPLRIHPDEASAGLAEGVHFSLTREPLSARFVSQQPVSDEALLHPYLALPALISNYWLGRQVLHGGAFAHEGHAWGVLGDRLAGKSSTLATLLRLGVPVLSDDVLVIDEHELFSGPPFVDLREDASSSLGGEPVGVLGNRPRYRLRAAPSPLSLPLGGFIVLDWAPATSLTRLSLPDRSRALAASSEIALDARSADSFFALVQKPAFRLYRSRDLDALPLAVSQMLAQLPSP